LHGHFSSSPAFVNTGTFLRSGASTEKILESSEIGRRLKRRGGAREFARLNCVVTKRKRDRKKADQF
jgi:hypothetical protein